MSAETRAAGDWLLQPQTVWGLVEERARRSPDRFALHDEHGVSLTFAELATRTECTAAALSALGVGPGSRVAWQLPTRLSTALVMFALARLGAVQLPLLPQYRERELSALLPPGRPDVVLVPGTLRGVDHEELVRGVLATCGLDVPVHVVRHEGLDADPDGLPAPPDDAGAPRWAYATSGSTGRPKAALHSDRSLLAAAHGFALHGQLGRAADEVVGVPFPLAHVGGVQMLSNLLMAGASGVLLEVFTPDGLLSLFRAHPITAFGGSPVFYQALLGLQRASTDPLFPHLRLLKGGGAPLPEGLYRQLRTGLGVQVAHDYGMTEVPMIAVADPDDPDDLLAVSDGRLVPGLEARTVLPDGTEGGPGEVGELQLRGAAVCLGYTDPTQEAAVFTDDGWFRTGDLAAVDEDGVVTVSGRVKDLIIRKGENIAPLEVEELLVLLPQVAEAAVVGLPDEERGELVCAVVRLHDPADRLTLDAVAAHLRGHGLMVQKVPERLEVLEELPKTGLGKVSKQALQQQFAPTPAAARG